MLVNRKIILKNFIKKNNNNLVDLNIIKYLLLSFMTSLRNSKIRIISKINLLFSTSKFEINHNSIKINVIYYVLNNNNKKTIIQLNKAKNKKMGKVNNKKSIIQGKIKTTPAQNETLLLNSIFNNKKLFNLVRLIEKYTNKNIQINFIRIYYPFLDANILAKWVLIQLRFIKFSRLIKKVIKRLILTNIKYVIKSFYGIKNKIFVNPTTFVGYKVILSGRSLLERSKPRMTKKEFQRGTFKSGKQDIITNYGSDQNTNDLGSLTASIILVSKRF